MTITKHDMGPVTCSDCDIPGLLAEIRRCLATRHGLTINFINAHAYNMCREDPGLQALMNGSDVVAADGMSIVWAARLFGFTIPGRCNMTDSFRAYLADPTSPPATAILVGGTQEEAERAAGQIMRDGPHLRIVRALSGFHSIPEYEAMLAGMTPADMVLVGMGTPKSEQLVAAANKAWPDSVVWHIGGGTVMFFAGSLIEAPVWMRRCGIQWLHRLLLEPRRMWRRYVIGNPLFVYRIMLSALRRPRASA